MSVTVHFQIQHFYTNTSKLSINLTLTFSPNFNSCIDDDITINSHYYLACLACLCHGTIQMLLLHVLDEFAQYVLNLDSIF